MLPASPGSGSGFSDDLPPAAKKASTEERRTDLNVDSIQKIKFHLVDNIFISICSRYLCVLHKAVDELTGMKPELYQSNFKIQRLI